MAGPAREPGLMGWPCWRDRAGATAAATRLVAEEFAAIQRAGGRYAFIVDSVFNSSPTHVQETCEALLRRGVTLP